MNGLFGTKHIILIAGCVALIVAGFFLSKRFTIERLCKIMLGIGIVSEFIKIFYYIIANEETYGGILPKTDLPFHLCSIQIIFFVILNISKNERLKRILLSFMMPSCMIGGVAAILIATQSSLNGGWIITAQYFIFHTALVLFGIKLLTSKEIKLNVKDYFTSIVFLFVLFFVAIYVNSILYDGNPNINFMYVASPPQSGLPFLNEDHGWLVYICHYAFLAITCITLTYIKPIIDAIRQKAQGKKQEKPVDIHDDPDGSSLSER
ncbi:MAG: YwaF family protein [Clostridia bacterium]|nr:YwaF family protein [Clostridia bacterium]